MIRSAVILMLAAVASACSPQARTVKTYEKDGIHFSHFSDWKVTQDTPIEGTPNSRSINIEGPNSALVTVICLPPATGATVEQFAAAVAEQRVKAIEEMLSVGSIKAGNANIGTSSSVRGKVSGEERDGILQHFNVRLLGQDVPHEARFFGVEGSLYEAILMAQVSSQDATKTYPAFDLILGSFSVD
jgi:hypothetical protein